MDLAPTKIEIVASLLFAFAILHTFLAGRFRHLAERFGEGSIGENFFHLLGEVEVVFGLWAGVLVLAFCVLEGSTSAVEYIESLNFGEPLFVFAIMAMAATRPVIDLVKTCLGGLAALIPVQSEIPRYAVALIFGPLLGSFITEPAAMTVTALVLRDRYFHARASNRLKYLTLAVLFVNISIGGTLTHFAAPPVVMVAAKWGWNVPYMLEHFGWKALIAILLNAIGAAWFLRRELAETKALHAHHSVPTTPHDGSRKAPTWLTFLHLGAIALVVLTAHHASIFMGIFLFFIGLMDVTKEYQDDLKLKDSLLVGFFLAGLVALGGLQRWWLQPLLEHLNEGSLFVGATALTAVTDNAALTYLGSQVENLAETLKYALVAGAVTGGGLTIIANAPNPAGYAILRERFGTEGLNPAKLFAAALIPTLIAAAAFWFLPTIAAQ